MCQHHSTCAVSLLRDPATVVLCGTATVGCSGTGHGGHRTGSGTPHGERKLFGATSRAILLQVLLAAVVKWLLLSAA